ncbi:MAG: transcription-repair coupling factor, partial [Proteobacteria bacterium]
DKLRLDENHVAFVVGSDTRAQKLQRILLDLDIDARVVDLSGNRWIAAPHRYPVVILKGHLASGFVMPDEHLVFISEAEIFAERSYRKSRKAQTNLRKLLGTLSQLQEGDYIVHTDYGIGVYRGLKHIDVEGLESDFLQIDYADSKLYLPVHSIGKAQKFAAAEGQVPKIDKLGSSRWTKTKQKVRESVAALAGDLIKLYAARSIVKGWRHEPQGAEDERFAEDFPFDETPDQLKAIQDTISDMVADRPMDRLVCGDVGFGKTEVAVRAAFKCLQHAKQVAVLVPTTILAEQHKHTFVNRFTGYPAKIAALSRFYSPKQNQAAIAELKSGELDIIIGTHRLLSRDVTFKDLGLLIVDEEHRFGVKHKEKLKAFKKQVDVLTLTATPIPRTLHMSLLGIRDISVISTPPHDRRTIRSYVASYDETLIADAIRRELRRNGQCFFVHNRVQNIDLVSATLSALVPEARFAFAHGQMSEHQLEKIMRAFLMREIDVLVSTTIIESGLDIPNANTMIIDRADTFGLAQLYQLRGRVGRSNRQAFCYFLIPKSQRIGVQAEERLRALQALDDLGLGFNLALRDMEIRGAGNLLGKEQSGNVLAVGFELFSKILKEAVLNLKGEDLDIKESIDPEIKLGIQAFLPEFYIPDVSERLVMYQRFAGAESSQEIDDLLEEMTDRFGSTPPEGLNLAELMRYRALLRDFGVVKAELSKGRLLLAFSPHAKVNLDRIFALTKNFPGRFKFNKNLTLALVLGENNDYSITRIFKHTENLLHEVAEAALRG